MESVILSTVSIAIAFIYALIFGPRASKVVICLLASSVILIYTLYRIFTNRFMSIYTPVHIVDALAFGLICGLAAILLNSLLTFLRQVRCGNDQRDGL